MQNSNSHTKLVRRVSHLEPSKVTPAARTRLRENLSTDAPLLYVNPSYLNHDTSHTIWKPAPPNSTRTLTIKTATTLLTTKGGKNDKKQKKVRNPERQNRKKVTQDKPHHTKANNLSPEFAFHTEDKAPLHKTHKSQKRISSRIIAVPLEMKQARSTSRTEKLPNNETRNAGLLPQ